MENEIDKIFNKAIEPLNTEPSEQFWRKAAENVVSQANKANEKKASRWRAAALILAASLLVSGYLMYKMQSGLKNIEQQVEAIKHTQNQNKVVEKTNNQSFTIADNSGRATPQNFYKANTLKHASIAEKTNKTSAIARVFNQSGNSAKPAERNANDKTNLNEQQNQPGISLPIAGTINSSLNTPETSNAVQKLNAKNADNKLAQIPDNATKVNVQKTISLPDTTKPVQSENTSVNNSVSKFSFSAFFAPEFSLGYKFKCDDSWGDNEENEIKNDEKQSFSYSAGVKMKYDISSNFSIGAGIALEVFSFNIKPDVIYAQKQPDGYVGYYINTSSGEINCPYYGANTGDSLKMNASSTRSYLKVPLQIEYSFINKEKYKFYLSGAIESNICLAENATMNWQNFYNESGVATSSYVQGSQSVYFSYYIGAGVGYNIAKHLSIYLEPGLHNALTSINNNTSVYTYPKLISLAAGLTYHI